MAISKVRTLLSLDEYAERMAIPGWLFNQVLHPTRPQRGGEKMWRQSGYYSDPNHIMGRDDLARSIATAERKIADLLGFWPAPKWICSEEVMWITPKRGNQIYIPELGTRWGQLISAGIEAFDLLNLYPVAIVYSDTDGDGVTDWATITYNVYLNLANVCELVVVPNGMDPESREWRIRPLEVSLSGGVLTIEGPKWLFVHPSHWLTLGDARLDDDSYFLWGVDLYRHYNDTTTQAQYQWLGNTGCSTNMAKCATTCQDACVSVTDRRVGHFVAETATYSASSARWVSASWAVTAIPHLVRIWYYSGYQDHNCYDCSQMGDSLKAAIRALTNVYLQECPCGRGLTRERWDHDREIMEMNNFDVALAQSAFGTTARGAVFARSVCATLQSLGQGG